MTDYCSAVIEFLIAEVAECQNGYRKLYEFVDLGVGLLVEKIKNFKKTGQNSACYSGTQQTSWVKNSLDFNKLNLGSLALNSRVMASITVVTKTLAITLLLTI